MCRVGGRHNYNLEKSRSFSCFPVQFLYVLRLLLYIIGVMLNYSINIQTCNYITQLATILVMNNGRKTNPKHTVISY